MPPVDLEQRLSTAFGSLGEPQLTADQRGALVPALRRRRARRQRLASGVGAVVVLAALATGLGLGLRSAPIGPVALPASCVEVQIGTAQSCRGTLVVSGERAAGRLAAPLAPEGSPVPANAAASAPSASTPPVGVTVGSRLIVTLPRTNGVRWSPVRSAPQPSSAAAGAGFSIAGGGVIARTTQVAGRTVATVTAVAPGTVVLTAHGRTTCPSGDTGCVVRSVTWSWVLHVAAPGTEPGSQSTTP
jgi:hypothetical protein